MNEISNHIKMKSFFFIVFIFSMLLLQSCNNTEPESSFRFSGDYISLYAPVDELFYSKLERVNQNDSVCGLKIYLSNTLTDFKNYFFTINKSAPEKSDSFVFIPFNKKISKNENAEIEIWAACENDLTKKYSMNISYEPQQQFESAGKTSYSKNIITIGETNLPFVARSVTDYLTCSPTADEINFVKQEFEKNISKKNTVSEKVKILAKEISDKLNSHRGTPSDYMDALPALEQYKRAMSGQDKVWCGNLAEIFSFVCVCFDIPVRKIGLGVIYDSSSDPVIMNAEGHTTTEYYDVTEKKWLLIDLTFNLIDAYVTGYENHKLNILEFYYALNNPGIEKKLMVEEYDAENHKMILNSISKSRNYLSYKKFFKLNQKFAYAYQGGYYQLFYQ